MWFLVSILVVDMEMTEFVSGRDGDTIPRDGTHPDQLRGMDVHTSTWIPLASSTLPFHFTGDDQSGEIVHSSKINDDNFDLSLSCEHCSEVGTLEPVCCVAASSSSMVVPGRNTRSGLSAYRYASSCYDVTRSPNNQINQVSEDVVSSNLDETRLDDATVVLN